MIPLSEIMDYNRKARASSIDPNNLTISYDRSREFGQEISAKTINDLREAIREVLAIKEECDLFFTNSAKFFLSQEEDIKDLDSIVSGIYKSAFIHELVQQVANECIKSGVFKKNKVINELRDKLPSEYSYELVVEEITEKVRESTKHLDKLEYLVERDKPQYIQRLTNHYGCSSCGTACENENHFCPVCGQRLIKSDFKLSGRKKGQTKDAINKISKVH